jgi:Cu/Ag efflux pump CusA
VRGEILPATWDTIKVAEQAYQDGDTYYIALVCGCLLVVAILVVFLFEWRTAAISRTAIPLSILDAAVVLRQLRIDTP